MTRKKLTKRRVGAPDWVLYGIALLEEPEVTLSVIGCIVQRTVLTCEDSDTIARFCADLRAMIDTIDTAAQERAHNVRTLAVAEFP